MIIENLIPVISLIGLGLIFSKVLVYLNIKLTLAEQIIYAIVISSALLFIPWSFFGLHKWKILFQLWPLILATMGLIFIGIEIYTYFKYFIVHIERIKDTKDFLLEKIYEFGISNTVILGVIIVLLSSYTIFNLILPFRDFDAIWMYIPDAMWYYRLNYIPQLNPLNFRLSTKEPVVSLLFTFSLYTTGSLTIKLFPTLFVIGWSLTVYVFIDKIWHNTTKALMGMLLFIISPFMYYIFNFWVYYQEIYVSFFYAVTLVALYSLFTIPEHVADINRSKLELFYVFIGSCAFALSLLAKLSGWSLLFIVMLVYPFSKKGKIPQSILLVAITGFLVIKASVTYYIGIGIFVAFYCIVLLYLMWKPLEKKEGQLYTNDKNNWIGLSIVPIGLVLGGFWLLDTYSKFHQYGTQITDLYVAIPDLLVKYTFQGTPLHSAHFLLESAHSTDFVSIVLYLLVGNMFVLLWILPKLRVVFDEQVKFFVLWTIGFFMLWLTYQSFASVRYLSVILVPIIVIVTHGFYKLYEDITKQKNHLPLGVAALACLLAFASYYYPLNISVLTKGLDPKTLNTQFLLSAYNYYHNSVYYIFFALVLSILFILVMRWYNNAQITVKPIKVFKTLTGKTSKVILLVIILFIPFLIPSAIFVSVNGNIAQFNSTFVYYQRPAYKEVVTTLLNENSPSSGIITIDDPGLPIYLNQPTLDLFAQQEGLRSIFSPNISELLQMLEEPLSYVKNNYNITIQSDILSQAFSFDYVVVPNYANNIYTYYASSLYNQTYLFPLLFQKQLFKLIYQNNEFLIFKRIYTVPVFSGIVNSWLYSSSSPKNSILGRVQENQMLSNSITLQLLCSLPEALRAEVTINATVNLTEGTHTLLLNTTQLYTPETTSTLYSISIPLTSQLLDSDSITIQNVTVTALINSTTSLILKN